MIHPAPDTTKIRDEVLTYLTLRWMPIQATEEYFQRLSDPVIRHVHGCCMEYVAGYRLTYQLNFVPNLEFLHSRTHLRKQYQRLLQDDPHTASYIEGLIFGTLILKYEQRLG